MKTVETVAHPIPPLWNEQSKILILGTMPSPKSREARFFYMHPQNRFWRVLPAVFRETLTLPNNAPDRAATISERRLGGGEIGGGIPWHCKVV